MNHFLELLSLVFLVLKYAIGGFAPTGCTYGNKGQPAGQTTCDFGSWTPPLDTISFGGPVYVMHVENIDGTIPSGVINVSII